MSKTILSILRYAPLIVLILGGSQLVMSAASYANPSPVNNPASNPGSNETQSSLDSPATTDAVAQVTY